MYVNIINASKKANTFVLVAQLDRVFGYEPKGQGFESLQARQREQASIDLGVCSFFALSRGIRTLRGQRADEKRLIIVFSELMRSPVPKRKAFGWASKGNA